MRLAVGTPQRRFAEIKHDLRLISVQHRKNSRTAPRTPASSASGSTSRMPSAPALMSNSKTCRPGPGSTGGSECNTSTFI